MSAAFEPEMPVHRAEQDVGEAAAQMADEGGHEGDEDAREACHLDEQA
jgi:hypothetical protein